MGKVNYTLKVTQEANKDASRLGRLSRLPSVEVEGRIQEFLKGGGAIGSPKRQVRRNYQTDSQKEETTITPLDPPLLSLPLVCSVGRKDRRN